MYSTFVPPTFRKKKIDDLKEAGDKAGENEQKLITRSFDWYCMGSQCGSSRVIGQT